MKKEVDLLEYAAHKESVKNTARKGLNVAAFLGPYTITFLMFFVFPLVLGIIIAFS